MNSERGWWKSALAFLAWSLVFALIYAQSPLYTSNQHTYFLHGLAQAGFGELGRDWMAQRQELMPVFSALVFLTEKIFHSQAPSYGYYALLMGVYLFSVFGVMDLLFDLRRSKARALAFTALFLAFHSAALRFVLSRALGAEAAFLFEGGVAGQRILGQVYQPSVFGVLLTLSIYLFLRKRPFWSLLPLAAAIYFHPVYLLAGALLTLAYMWILWRETCDSPLQSACRLAALKKPFLLGLASLLLVAPMAAYTAWLNRPPSPEIGARALDILVNFRNPHHALISSWLDWTVAVKAALLLAALILLRRTRLFPLLILLTLGVLLLTGAQALSGSQTLALLFPWRVSVLLVPLSLAAVLAWLVATVKLPERPVIAFSLLLLGGLMAVGVMRFQIESARLRAGAARPVMAWMAAHRSPVDVYLVPPQMADFRLNTGMPIFADFDVTPDRPEDVLEWYRRVQKAYAFYYGGQSDPCAALRDFAAAEGLTRAVVPAGEPATACPALPVLYEDAHYLVYEIK